MNTLTLIRNTVYHHKSRWIVILLALALIKCEARSEKRQSRAKEQTIVSVSTAPVKNEIIQRKIEVTGTLAPWEEAVVSLEAEGRLVKVPVDLGAKIRRGSLLAQIAPQEYEFKKVQAEAELAAAEADFKRIKDLAAKQMASMQQLDESRRRLDISRTAADLARKKLTDTQMVSPINGMVAKRLVNVGEYVRIGTPAFNVVRISPLKLKADVPERYSAELKVGDAVEVSSEAIRGEPLKGKIVRISPIVAIDSRSFTVEARIENPEEKVKPGTFARATIGTAKNEKALTIPESAVVNFAGNPRVFVVVNNQAKERTVEIAGKYQSRVLVAKGLSPEEIVVIAGADLLTDGQPVTVR